MQTITKRLLPTPKSPALLGLLTVDGCGDKVDSKSCSVPGFVATSYDRTGEGAIGRILWSDVTRGKALVWLLDSSDDMKLETAIENKPGWKANSHRVGLDGSGKILWEHRRHKAVLDGRLQRQVRLCHGIRKCSGMVGAHLLPRSCARGINLIPELAIRKDGKLFLLENVKFLKA